MKKIILITLILILALNCFSLTAIVKEKNPSPYFYETEIELGLTEYVKIIEKKILIEGLDFIPSTKLIESTENNISFSYEKENEKIYLKMKIDYSEKFPKKENIPIQKEFLVKINFGAFAKMNAEELPEIKIKLNFNEHGIILTQDNAENAELINGLAEKKGWEIIASSKEIQSKEKMELVRNKLIEKFNEKPFKYLLIIGSEKFIPEIDTNEWFYPKQIIYTSEEQTEYTNIFAPLDYLFFSTIPFKLNEKGKISIKKSNIAVGRIPFDEKELIEFSLNPAPEKTKTITALYPDGKAISEEKFEKEMNTKMLGNFSEIINETKIINKEKSFLINPSKEFLDYAFNEAGIINIVTHGYSNCILIEPTPGIIKETIQKITKKEKTELNKENIKIINSNPFVILSSCYTAIEIGKQFLLFGAAGYLGYINPIIGTQQNTLTKNNLSKTIGEAIIIERNKKLEETNQYYSILSITPSYYGMPDLLFPKQQKDFSSAELSFTGKEIKLTLPETKNLIELKKYSNNYSFSSTEIPELTETEKEFINSKTFYSAFVQVYEPTEFYFIPSNETKNKFSGRSFLETNELNKIKGNRIKNSEYKEFLKTINVEYLDAEYPFVSNNTAKKEFCISLLETPLKSEEKGILFLSSNEYEFPALEIEIKKIIEFKEFIKSNKLKLFFELNGKEINPILGQIENKPKTTENQICFNLLEMEYINLIAKGLTEENRIKIIIKE
jgi:hypothetical protein